MNPIIVYLAGIVTGIIAALSVPSTIKDVKHIVSAVKIWMG